MFTFAFKKKEKSWKIQGKNGIPRKSSKVASVSQEAKPKPKHRTINWQRSPHLPYLVGVGSRAHVLRHVSLVPMLIRAVKRGVIWLAHVKEVWAQSADGVLADVGDGLLGRRAEQEDADGFVARYKVRVHVATAQLEFFRLDVGTFLEVDVEAFDAEDLKVVYMC